MDSDLRIEKQQTEAGILILGLRGEVDLYSCPALRAALSQNIESESAEVVLDMAQVTYMDSAGLAALLDATRQARDCGGEVHLVNMIPYVQHVLEITRLDQILTSHPSMEAALEAARGRE